MALSDQIEALAKKHGATSYRNRADTQHPAFGFTPAQLLSLLAEVRKDDDALIRQLESALSWSSPHADATHGWKSEDWARKRSEAITAARARLLESDLSKLTERGAKAWTGVDAQALREGKPT